MSKKLYWQEPFYLKQYPTAYHLKCPKCGLTFTMPKTWGVWKGCPKCWIKLDYRKGIRK